MIQFNKLQAFFANSFYLHSISSIQYACIYRIDIIDWLLSAGVLKPEIKLRWCYKNRILYGKGHYERNIWIWYEIIHAQTPIYHRIANFILVGSLLINETFIKMHMNLIPEFFPMRFYSSFCVIYLCIYQHTFSVAHELYRIPFLSDNFSWMFWDEWKKHSRINIIISYEYGQHLFS